MSLHLLLKRTEFFKVSFHILLDFRPSTVFSNLTFFCIFFLSKQPAIASTSRALSTAIDATSVATESLPVHSLTPTSSTRTAFPSSTGKFRQYNFLNIICFFFSLFTSIKVYAYLPTLLSLSLILAAPTPYHPFVHIPLLSFTPQKLRSDLDPTYTPSTTPLIVPLPSHLFNTPSRPTLLHKLITSHLASLRQGNASTKNRSEVNYSGKKLRPQKGTGKARLGSRGSPMLRGGGRSHGPRTKGLDGWNRKVNRKEEILGLRVCLSEKWRRGDLVVVDQVGMEEIATRRLAVRMGSRGWLDSLVILSSERANEGTRDGEKFIRSAGNLPNVAVCEEVKDLGVWDIVKRRKVIIDLGTLDSLIARLDPEWEDIEEVENEEDEDGLLDLGEEQ